MERAILSSVQPASLRNVTVSYIMEAESITYGEITAPRFFILLTRGDDSAIEVSELAALDCYFRGLGSSLKGILSDEPRILLMLAAMRTNARVVADLESHKSLYSNVPEYVHAPLFSDDKLHFWCVLKGKYERWTLDFDKLTLESCR